MRKINRIPEIRCRLQCEYNVIRHGCCELVRSKSVRVGKNHMAKPSAKISPKWWEEKYKNRGNIEDFLGNTQPFLVEVLAVRIMQTLNGNVSLDWAYQNCTLATVRSLAPGFRWAYILTGIYIALLSLFWLETPLLFRYDLVSPQPTMRFGNTTLGVCMFLWCLDYAILSTGWYLVARVGSEGSNVLDRCCLCFSTTTEDKDKQKTNVLISMVYALFFFAVFVIGCLATHTILGHVYSAKNVWFVYLLAAQAFMLFVSSLGDLCNVGSPWGIQQSSHIASIILSFRGLFLMPLTIIWSIASVIASFPPSYCATC
tara:strand:- start:129 stop:1070 length:942 start_codon:yes stop_codon:yes gene_type:complete